MNIHSPADGHTSQGSVHGRRVALVLGGGAARGLAHIGVLEVLEREAIELDTIVGTSMGGLVGALSATGLKAQDLSDIARGFHFPRWFLPGTLLDWHSLFAPAVPALSGTFEQLHIPLAVTAVDLEAGAQVVLQPDQSAGHGHSGRKDLLLSLAQLSRSLQPRSRCLSRTSAPRSRRTGVTSCSRVPRHRHTRATEFGIELVSGNASQLVTAAVTLVTKMVLRGREHGTLRRTVLVRSRPPAGLSSWHPFCLLWKV